jgi:iron(III) transport system substrate-binding protein
VSVKSKSYALLLAASLLLGACSPGSTSVADESREQTANDAGALVIYSGRVESLVSPIIQQFAEATGIEIQVRYGSTTEMAAALLEEGHNSPADLFYAQDPGGLGAVEEAGLLADLPVEILESVGTSYVSISGQWVGITARARVVVYNTEMLAPADLPDDLRGFADPRWAGRIGIAPTNSSFLTMITGMRQLWGEDETRSWLEAIVANQPVYYENNTAIVAATAAGEVEVGLVNHYYLYRFLTEEGESFPARNYYMASGDVGSMVMVSGVGILANGDNQENAQRFVEFMLSTVAQEYFASQTFEYPLVEGVAVSSLLPPLSELNAPEISLSDLADLDGTTELLQDVGMLP